MAAAKMNKKNAAGHKKAVASATNKVMVNPSPECGSCHA
jgi:hypothetical protein